MLERIELYDNFPGNLSIMSMCKRIYREVNIKSKPNALAFLAMVRDNLVRILRSPAEIDDNPDIKARGVLVFKLLHMGSLEDAYNLALKKKVTEQGRPLRRSFFVASFCVNSPPHFTILCGEDGQCITYY